MYIVEGHYVPCSRKLSREKLSWIGKKTEKNFRELVKKQKKLLWIGHFCHAKGRHPPEFGSGNFRE